MPVIPGEGDYERWLDPSPTCPHDVEDLLVPYRGEMRAYAASRAVNSPKHVAPVLLEPA